MLPIQLFINQYENFDFDFELKLKRTIMFTSRNITLYLKNSIILTFYMSNIKLPIHAL